MRAGAGLLPLLLLLPACSRAAGNPVNHAAQQGSAHRITAESVAAWESLSRCEWAPLCPSLLIAVSFAGDNARQRAELVDGLGVLATELRGRAAFGYLYLPEDEELGARLLGHSPPGSDLPLSVVFRRGIVLQHAISTPDVEFLEAQLGLPSHEHGEPGEAEEEDTEEPAEAPPPPAPGAFYNGASQTTRCRFAAGARVYGAPTSGRGGADERSAGEPAGRRRDPKTGAQIRPDSAPRR